MKKLKAEIKKKMNEKLFRKIMGFELSTNPINGKIIAMEKGLYNELRFYEAMAKTNIEMVDYVFKRVQELIHR